VGVLSRAVVAHQADGSLPKWATRCFTKPIATWWWRGARQFVLEVLRPAGPAKIALPWSDADRGGHTRTEYDGLRARPAQD